MLNNSWGIPPFPGAIGSNSVGCGEPALGLIGELPEGVSPSEFIRQELKRRIDTGELHAGARIPSEFDLVRELGVPRNQSRQALRDLEREGYVERFAGRGSFVAPASERAKRLGMKGFRMAAMASPVLQSDYKRKVIDSFGRRLREDDFHALNYFLSVSDDSELRFLRESRNSGIEGLALWIRDRSEATVAVLNAFKEACFPFVLCDRYLPGFDVDSVATDNVEIGYRLTRGLIAQGHRQIAFLSLWFGMTPIEDRLAGYRRALEEAGLPQDDCLVTAFQEQGETADSMAGRAEHVVKGVLACRHRPTAILCTDDRVVSHVAAVLERLGYRLPGDMAFAAVDDDGVLSDTGLPVLTATQSAEAIGRQTAELLLARIRAPRKEAEQRFIQAHFTGGNGNTDTGEEFAAEEGGVTASCG
jgi:GntR family transcriptional regulator, arabinose operon transcriptional repressor